MDFESIKKDFCLLKSKALMDRLENRLTVWKRSIAFLRLNGRFESIVDLLIEEDQGFLHHLIIFIHFQKSKYGFSRTTTIFCQPSGQISRCFSTALSFPQKACLCCSISF